MAKSKKNAKVSNGDGGVLKLIKCDPDLLDDTKIKPNYQLDECVAVCVDANCNHELFKIKQTTVTEENIKSTINSYGDKYKLGDTYQEWVSMGRYTSNVIDAAKCYIKLVSVNEISKLKYCKDINKIVEINNNIRDTLEKFAVNETMPKVIKQLSVACDKLFELQDEIKIFEETKAQVRKETEDLLNLIRESRKIVVENMPKEKKRRLKLEEN